MRCPKCKTENILYVSSNYKHICKVVLVAACQECNFTYDSKKNGGFIWKIK